MLRPAIVLDAAISLAEALDAVSQLPDRSGVIVRRRSGIERFCYIYQARDFRDLADRYPEKKPLSLESALELHEYRSSETYQVREESKPVLDNAFGVLLDGDYVLGILEPMPRMAARGGGGGSPATAAAPSAPAASPYEETPPPGAAAIPFSAYPKLDAPDNVASEQAFDLVIGLAREAQAGVAGGQFTLVTAADAFDLVVQVMAPGFRAPQGVRRFLHVDRKNPEKAEARIRLVAPSVETGLLLSHLEVEFSFEGHLLARAWREVRVAAGDAQLPDSAVTSDATGFSVVPDVEAPDLQVTVNESPDGSTLEWLFTSSLPVSLPENKVETRLSERSAESFALREIKTVADRDGTKFIDEQILGIGRNISRVMPNAFWQVLGEVWKQIKNKDTGTAPSLLLVSSEPYIPWELASTEDDWLDPDLLAPDSPPILGAQLRMGRWIPPGPKTPRGVERPSLPPPHQIDIGRLGLVVGDYLAEMGQRPLPQAKEEGRTLSLRYNTFQLSAEIDPLNDLLEDVLEQNGGKVELDALHIACHGEVDAQNPRHNGIVLSDLEVRLSPNIISGSRFCRNREPFVFLNACQLGFSASELLADYGGMAGAFLREGTRAFLAPLWSVADDVARDIAVSFYERTLDEGTPVSEVMRQIRSQFDLKEDIPASTYLAYVFFGHPNLVLRYRKPSSLGTEGDQP